MTVSTVVWRYDRRVALRNVALSDGRTLDDVAISPE